MTGSMCFRKQHWQLAAVQVPTFMTDTMGSASSLRMPTTDITCRQQGQAAGHVSGWQRVLSAWTRRIAIEQCQQHQHRGRHALANMRSRCRNSHQAGENICPQAPQPDTSYTCTSPPYEQGTKVGLSPAGMSVMCHLSSGLPTPARTLPSTYAAPSPCCAAAPSSQAPAGSCPRRTGC
jgi:hypothetical protein